MLKYYNLDYLAYKHLFFYNSLKDDIAKICIYLLNTPLD